MERVATTRAALPGPAARLTSPPANSMKKAPSFALPLAHPISKTNPLGSPNQLISSRAHSPAMTSTDFDSPYAGVAISPGAVTTTTTKTRPTTAMPLASTVTLNALIGSASSPQLPSFSSTQSGPLFSPKQSRQQRPESAASTPSKQPFSQPKKKISPLQSFSNCPNSPARPPRCAGCGAPAEMCFSCFSIFKQQDGVKYKAEVVHAVDDLLGKASTRAQAHASEIALQWIFNLWRGIARVNKHRRIVAENAARRMRLHRQWAEWQRFVFRRRVLGAMLYAENQQTAMREKTREVSHLQGDVFELHANASVRAQLQKDELEAQEQKYIAFQQSISTKDQELVAVRKELRDARARITFLESQVIDPRELERLRTESVDYKKISFQLLGALFQQMDNHIELLSSGEGKHNLAQVFSKDMLQQMDKPENPAFFNPLADLETAAACADVDATTSASGSGSASSNTSPTSFLAYEASIDRADKLVMQWVNWMVAKQPSDWLSAPRMVNFHSSLSDGRVFGVTTKLLHTAMSRVRVKRQTVGGGPASISKLEASSVLRENGEDLTEIAMERYLEKMRVETSAEKRLELMINTVGQALWLPLGLLNARDILAGDAEFNFAALAYMFCTCTPPQDDAYYATCSDFRQQLTAVKAKWRELRDGNVADSKNGSSKTSNRTAYTAATLPQNGDGEDISLSAKMKLALSHTLDLKKRIDHEDARAHEGHVQWLKAARIVMRKCFVSYTRLARGQVGLLTKLEATRGDANEAFSKIPKHKLQDLALPYEDFAWEAKLLQTYLITVYCDLARIYRGYASRHGGSGGTGAETITVGDLTQLLGDCRVLEGGMSEADLHTILKRMDPKMTSINPHRALPPLEFLEVLVRIARRKYPAETHRVTISEAFCLFVDNFVLPFAFRADVDLFRKQLEEPNIRRLMIKYADALKELYAKYAAEDPKQKRRKARMTAFTFGQCMLDKGILDMTLNSEKVLGIVQKVTRGSVSTSESESTVGKSREDEEITYPEFEEAVVAIACHKFPDPYSSLESRAEKFFAIYIRERRG